MTETAPPPPLPDDDELLARRVMRELDLEPEALTYARADVVAALRQGAAFSRVRAAAEIIGDQACRVCGCTYYRACDGGCWWVQEDLCSECAGTADA